MFHNTVYIAFYRSVYYISYYHCFTYFIIIFIKNRRGGEMNLLFSPRGGRSRVRNVLSNHRKTTCRRKSVSSLIVCNWVTWLRPSRRDTGHRRFIAPGSSIILARCDRYVMRGYIRNTGSETDGVAIESRACPVRGMKNDLIRHSLCLGGN